MLSSFCWSEEGLGRGFTLLLISGMRRGEERREDDKSEQTVWLAIPLDILCDSP